LRLPGLVYESPHTFTAKQRLQLAVLPPIIAGLYRGLASTARWDIRHPEHLETEIEQRGHSLLATWHECTGAGLCYFRGRNFHSTASFSFDGELAARICQYFGTETVRGSSSRGGSIALDQMEKALPQVPVVGITLDGPRGPRRAAKPGIAILSARTRTPIVPMAVIMHPCWNLRSWDRFLVPKPRCRVVVDFAPAIAPPESESPEHVEVTRLEVEQTLNAMTEGLEREFGIE